MKKMMSLGVAIAAFALVGASQAFAAGDVDFGKVQLVSIKSLQVSGPKEDAYTCQIVVQIANSAEKSLRLKDGKYTIHLDAQRTVKTEKGEEIQKKSLDFGSGILQDVKLMKAKVDGPFLTDVTVELALGAKDAAMARLIDLFNIVGDPAYDVTMRMVGDAELWVDITGTDHWVNDRVIKVDFSFKPSLKREVIFK